MMKYQTIEYHVIFVVEKNQQEFVSRLEEERIQSNMELGDLISRLDDRIEELKKENGIQQTSISTLANRLEIVEQEVESKNKTIEELTSRLESVENGSSRMESLKNDIRSKIKEVQDMIFDCDNEELETEFNQLKLDIKRYLRGNERDMDEGELMGFLDGLNGISDQI